MPTTNRFFMWFYYGLNGLGGWFIFFLIGLIAVLWLLYDSNNRRLPAIGWRMGAILTWLLILPAVVYRFTVDPLATSVSNPLAGFGEPIFYLGLLGGVLPPVIAAGYFVTYQGLRGCANGHVFESALGECPECARLAAPPPMPPISAQVSLSPTPIGREVASPPRPVKHQAGAWVVTSNGHNHSLYLGETTLGRSSKNDIQLADDNTISREHAKILEQNGHFRIIDLGSDNHTRVNGRIIRQPLMLEHGDDIQLGDNTHLRFVKS